jgi:long-chain acyl-CoA synthetase
MLMHQLLFDGASRKPDKTAFRWVDRNIALSYAQSVEAMERFAGALHHLGVRRGDRVTIFAHNGIDYLIGLFACWRIGAIAALVNVRFADELEFYLNDHTPKLVIYTHDMGTVVRRAARLCSAVKTLVCMDGPQEGAEALPNLLAADLAPPSDTGDEDAIAHLSYTSGTSGRPKGACLGHEPTMRATRCIAERLRLTSADSCFGPTALSSSYQLVANLLPGLHRVATVNVMGRWTPETGWDAMEATGATAFAANPTLLSDVLTEFRKRGRTPGRLRYGLSGGGPVPGALKKAWRDELRLPLAESYGQSELGGFVGLGNPEFEPDERLGTVGPALPDKEVRIFRDDAREATIGEIGEICIRGGFMKGYWGQPEKTAMALRGGWLHTGDAGLIDGEGYITMRGRYSELIKVGGVTWYPRDIEDALCEIPGVAQASLVGLSDAQLGVRPIACVTLESGSRFDPDEARGRIEPALPYDLSSLMIRVIDVFPMTPTGKISKAQLVTELSAPRS